MKKFYFFVGLWAALFSANAQKTATFDDVQFENSWWNGSDGSGGFYSGGFYFLNSYNAEWGSWSGFAVSNVTDNQTRGWGNQYSAIAGGGALQTDNYAVSYASGFSEVDFHPTRVSGMYLTNSTYTYWAIKEGDDFSKKFGGANGSDPDWLKLTVAGISSAGDTTGIIEFFLADFRFDDDEKDYIVDSWEWLDLSGLGEISKLRFSLSSSDAGDWGMNTPAYFCIDQLNHQDVAPALQKPIATIGENGIPDDVFYVSLDSVFYDPDSEIQLKLEYIDNPALLLGQIVKGGKPGSPEKTMLALNVTPGMTGEAEVTISATSNGKTAYHNFKVVLTAPVSVQQTYFAEIKVYPNPVKDYLVVESSSEINYLNLTDNSGRVVWQQSAISENRFRIDEFRTLPSGIYLLNLKTGSGIFQQKILK